MDALKAFIIALLRQEAIKRALASLVTKGIIRSVGFRAWLAEIILKNAFDEFVAPIILWAIRSGQLSWDRTQQKVILKNVNEAKRDKNLEKYLDSISRV